MNVTAENFEAAAAELESLLPSCAFYAIDEEMTGIMLNKETTPSVGDSCEVRYAKMRRVVNECAAALPATSCGPCVRAMPNVSLSRAAGSRSCKWVFVSSTSSRTAALSLDHSTFTSFPAPRAGAAS